MTSCRKKVTTSPDFSVEYVATKNNMPLVEFTSFIIQNCRNFQATEINNLHDPDNLHEKTYKLYILFSPEKYLFRQLSYFVAFKLFVDTKM